MPLMSMVMPVPKLPSGLEEGGKSNGVAVWYLQAMRLKIRDNHISYRQSCKWIPECWWVDGSGRE